MGRGQITVFIIIGLILLFGAGVLIYYQQEAILRPFEEQIPTVQTGVPQVQGVYEYITQCVGDVSKQAIILVGQHGGYVNPEQLVAVPQMPMTAAANSLELFEGTGAKVAYWRQLKPDMNCHKKGGCIFESKRPPLTKAEGGNSMQSQIEQYVKENLATCLNLRRFRQRGMQIDTQEIESRVVIRPESVLARVTMPTRVTFDEKDYEFEDYGFSHNVDLHGAYGLATQVTNLENQERFLEKSARIVVASFGGRERMLPPMSDFEFKFDPGKMWMQYEVQNRVQQLLTSYVPVLQVPGTRNYKYIFAPEGTEDPELFEVLFNRQFAVPLEEPKTNLGVSFQYLPNWPMHFDMNCRGMLCMPEGMTVPFLPIPIGMQKYEFSYDFSYPVVVDLTDPDAFGGEGYSFKIALQSHIRNNQPLTALYQELAEPVHVTESLLCNIQNRQKTANFTVTDGLSGKPLDGALVSYACSNEICTIGETEDGTLQGKLPPCLGGEIIVQKHKYESKRFPYDTTAQMPPPVSITLFPEVKLNVTIRKYVWRDDRVNYGRSQAQKPYERTLIMLERITGPGEDPYVIVSEVVGGVFERNQSMADNIPFLPGKYNVTIMSTAYPPQPWYIPPHESCQKVPKSGVAGAVGQKDTKCQYVPQETIVFNKERGFPTGLATYSLEITPQDLRGKRNAVFYNIVQYLSDRAEDRQYSRREFPPNTINDLMTIGQIQEEAEANRAKLKPAFE